MRRDLESSDRFETTGVDVAAVIRDLADIDEVGHLSEMIQQYSLDCYGLPRDSAALHGANAVVRARVVGQALAGLFGWEVEACISAARSVLLRHARRETALALIDHYQGRTTIEVDVEVEAAAPSAAAAPATGMPLVARGRHVADSGRIAQDTQS